MDLVLALVALSTIIMVAIIKSSIRPERFPPGPITLPLVGYIPFLDVRNLGVAFSRLAKKYGDIYSVYLGRTPIVVLNSWPLIKEAFDRNEFSGRPGMFSGTFFQKGKTGICTTEGDIWKKQRDFLHGHLKEITHGNGLKGMEDVMMDEVHDIKMDLEKKVGEQIALSYRLNVSIINILWSICSGRRLHAQQQEFQSVYDCIDKITQFMSKAAIFSFLPILAKILPESITKIERGRYHRNRFINISEKWIREHKEDYRGNRTGDFQDSYLEKIQNGDEAFSEKNLGAIMREMFVMGAETQSVMLRWSIRLLSVHKDIQRKVQDELDEVVGRSRDVSWNDRKNLPYTRATLAEIQRFSDIVPTGLGHKTLADVEFHGYKIPKGTIVIGNLTECLGNPKFWKKPDEFYPEHFLNDKGQFVENMEGFVPYSTGMRRCPGEDLADMGMFLILANVLKTFSLKPPAGDNGKIGTQYKAGTGVLRNPKPFFVVLTDREA